jgi:hypothetical protein
MEDNGDTTYDHVPHTGVIEGLEEFLEEIHLAAPVAIGADRRHAETILRYAT